MIQDTITAIATPIGEGALGMVRLSGPRALAIANAIFKSKSGIAPSCAASHTLQYGWIAKKTKGRESNRKQIIDEVLLSVMRAPKTYTREDIVEISCHGGARALQNILELVIKQGARLAEPGEFTKRAFLNGRIDLSKAEAVLDIIRAKTDAALKLGVEQLSGGLSGIIERIRLELIDVLANIEAAIDFSEEDITPKSQKILEKKVRVLTLQLQAILNDAQKTSFLREGIKVTICGRPNVGKSSLLNALLKKERAIVTPLAGTTRDVIEETITLNGIGIRLIDTAGMIQPRDLIEHHAIRLTKNSIALSDIVLLVFDASQKLTKKDKELINELKSKDVIAVLNKIDLKQKVSVKALKRYFKHIVSVSSLAQKNLDTLEKAITHFVYKGKIISSEGLISTNARHVCEITKAKNLLEYAHEGVRTKVSFEFIALDVKSALSCLDRITGKAVDDAVLDRIFGEFCIGK